MSNGNFAAGKAAALAVVAAGLCLTPAGAALADELPSRKPGLWSIKMGGTPLGGHTLQECVDKASDERWRTQSQQDATCSKPVVKRDGARYRFTMECTANNQKQTVEGVYTMTGDTGFTGETVVRFTPPIQGMAQMKMTSEGRWMGACKPGMKPGDTVREGSAANPFGNRDVGKMSAEELQKAAQDFLKQFQQK